MPRVKTKYRRVMLKISGEGFCHEAGQGLDARELRRIAEEIFDVAKLGVELSVVVGGGNFLRGKSISEAAKVKEATGHYMGMLATVMNALALQDTLEELDLETRVLSAIQVDRLCEKFILRRALRHLEKGRVVILASGTGNPFVTTDSCAALRAVELGADVLLKATKVDGVYSSDPKKNRKARLYEHLTYNQFLQKGLEVMDFGAVNMCREKDVPIVVFNLKTPGNMRKVVIGRSAIGTLISKKR